MRISREQMFMDIAEVVAKRSACLRNNVGAVIVNEENNIVAIGYNGPAAGVPQCTRDICHAGCDLAIHAEDNAILRMPSECGQYIANGQSIAYQPYMTYRLFCTVSPCKECAKLIVNRKDITKVYFRYPYRDPSGIFYLLANGIEVYQILSGGIINEQEL